MRRLLVPLGAALLLAGCHFPQGWHWPRTFEAMAPSASTQQTVVYWAKGEAFRYQDPVIAWAAAVYDAHPELAIKLVDTCPAGRNCVVWDTGNNGGGLTSVSIGSNRHLVAARVVLDDQVTDDATGRKIAYHEACHALGGGFTDEAGHRMCNYENRAHNNADISAVYHDDPG